MTVNTLTTTKIGVTSTSISGNTNVNVKGLESLRHKPTLNLTSTGFISSRQALSILPRERTPPLPNPRKRKSNSISSANPSKSKQTQSKQTTIKSYMDPMLDILHEKPAKSKKLPSSGVIQDRGRPVTVKSELPPIQQISKCRPLITGVMSTNITLCLVLVKSTERIKGKESFT
jgi:hypothetical protein